MADRASEVLEELAPVASAWPAEVPGGQAGLSKGPVPEGTARAPGSMKDIQKAINQANQFDLVQKEFMSFLNGYLSQVIADRYSLDHTRRLPDPDLDNAVQAAFDKVDTALGRYFGLLYKAMQVLADSRGALLGLGPPLSKAAARPGFDPHNLTELDDFLRRRRSWIMYTAATTATVRGVWKVGDSHIRDLREGPAKVDPEKVNVVTKDEFDQLLKDWKAKSPPRKPGLIR